MSGPAFENLPAHTVEEGTTTYTTNELNQYPQITAPGGVIGLDYDDDGNLTNDGTFSYAYDAENRMIAATPLYPVTGSKKLEATYDYQGRRVQKTIYTYNAGTWVLEATKTFVYDGWNVIREQTTTGSTTTTDFYVWGLDLSGSLQGAGGIGGLLLWKKETGTFLYLYDANGNVGQLVNVATGAIAARYEYDPFGNTLVADGPEAQNNLYRFSTRPYDAETGLYAYIFRYYSPRLGRWWTRDPIEEEGGMNLYEFVGNDPINGIDLFGLQWEISREYSSQAEAICCNDTVEALANKIGLDAQAYRSWLGGMSSSLPSSATKKISYGKFSIPNTVYAYWAGHLSWFGRWHVSWHESIAYLRNLGFLVLETRHVAGGGSFLEEELIRLAQGKYLHGLYFWGHGSPGYGLHVAEKNMVGLIEDSSWETVLVYSRISGKLPYKMALGLMFACFSNTGQFALYSNAPGGIWHGYDKILYPIFGNFHVQHWISPGSQGTQIFE